MGNQWLPPDIDGPAYFLSLDMTDWDESNIKSVCHYLRGGNYFVVPVGLESRSARVSLILMIDWTMLKKYFYVAGAA